MSKIKKLYTALIIFTTVLLPQNAMAQEEFSFIDPFACGSGFTAMVQVPTGEYEVFVTPGEFNETRYKLKMSSFEDGNCVKIADTKRVGTSMQHVGETSFKDAGFSGSLILESSTSTGFASADAPTVIFKPKSLSCDPLEKCTIQYDNQLFQLQPKKLSMKADNLRVAMYQPVEGDSVKEVLYSVDGKPVHKTPALEAFNIDYVPSGKHDTQRTIVLKSGQALVEESIVERDFSPMVFIRSSYLKYRNAVLAVFYIFIFIITTSSLWWLVRRIYMYFKWRRLHTASTAKGPVDLTAVLSHDTRAQRIKILRRSGLAIVGTIGLFLITTSFLFSSFTVDGLSMFDTLKDREVKALNKLPVTFAKLNRRDYLPRRGEIIVFTHEDNNLFDDSLKQEKRYVVKRVLGLPGERVTLKNNVLTVYNDESPNGFNPDLNVDWNDKIKPVFNAEKAFKITIGANEIFVAGDNRDESIDSRFYGPIPVDSIVGIVIK